MRAESLTGADVAIVGCGPVGQALAVLLGRCGHRVVVFERYRESYPLPRAVHLDHEIMRLLQSLEVADELTPTMVALREYEWFGADGEPLLTLGCSPETPSGWDSDYLFDQPTLEAALARRVSAEPTVTVARGWSAESLTNSADGAELTVRRMREDTPGRLTPTEETLTVAARWVIGADGANSSVRTALGIAQQDFGFHEQWLVVDAQPRDPAAFAALPDACQWCDPRRPATHVQSGRGQHRWEFMLLPGENPADFADPASVWELLSPWYRPEDGSLIRSAIYEFRSVLAERMRERRVLLAGDAAHLAPPVLGQGLCSGLRDAANIAWKLDLVLRGLAPEGVLDSVAVERRPQNEWVINFSVQLGSVLCQLDPQAAAERDAMLREAGPPPAIALPPISDGVVRRAEDTEDPLAGTLSVQGWVAARDGLQGRFDDVVGRGFCLIVTEGDAVAHLSARQRDLIESIEMTRASLDPVASDAITDLDGRLTRWLADAGARAVLIRPDFYVFGCAPTMQELPALIDELLEQLRVGSTAMPMPQEREQEICPIPTP